MLACAVFFCIKNFKNFLAHSIFYFRMWNVMEEVQRSSSVPVHKKNYNLEFLLVKNESLIYYKILNAERAIRILK